MHQTKRQCRSMQAILQNSMGDETTLFVGETTVPSPGDGEVLIRGMNMSKPNCGYDAQIMPGLYPVPKGASAILGVEVSGYIHELGPNCSDRFKVGDACMALLQGGGYAEFAVAYECTTMRVPEGLDMNTLASIPEQWMTAYQLLFKVAQVRAGETVLLHAGASGVGQAAIQLATNAGAKCITTCRSDEKVACCLSMGAIASFNVKDSSEFVELTRGANGGRGVDVTLDPVGASYAAQNLEVLDIDGRLVLYGLMGGKGVEDVNFLGKILAKRISIMGSTLRGRDKGYKEILAQAIEEEVVPRIVSGDYKVLVDSVYPMTTEGVQSAHRRMATNQNIGKIVITVSGN